MMRSFFSAAQAVMARSAKPLSHRQAFSGRSGGTPFLGSPRLFSWQPLAIAGAALLAAAYLTPLSADEIDDLRSQVQQMQQQLQAMQGGGGGSGPAAAQQVVQMQQLQQQLASMQGEIEQVQIKVNDLSDKLDRAQKDNEFRLSALEQAQQNGGGAPGAAAPGGSSPAPSSAAPSPAPTAPATSGSNGVTPTNDQAAGQPHVLGTLNSDQALPQAPAGAAAAAAAAASSGGGSAGNVVLPGDTPKDQYEYAVSLLQKGSYPEAEVALKTFLKDHSSDPLAGNAQYWLGETYYARQDYKNAAVAFAEGYQKYPNSPKVVDNLLKLGMALGQSGQKDNACVALKQLDKKFPDASGTIKDRSARAKQRFGCPA
ncbi:MAG TPA: tol-pal system protein YbgF [Dongiaceae bacterium]|nr:tol-pal system protein YbgF [Dongiaceae bacterium]